MIKGVLFFRDIVPNFFFFFFFAKESAHLANEYLEISLARDTYFVVLYSGLLRGRAMMESLKI